jgi:hypothetical protein
VVGQAYNTYGSPEEIILGNEALLKCSVPSFVADFVSVIGWTDSEAGDYFLGKTSDGTVTWWLYSINMILKNLLLGARVLSHEKNYF